MPGSADSGEYLRRVRRPHERLCELIIVDLDEALDFGDQFTHAGEHTAIQRAALELGEPPFDGIEPRRTGGREVKVHPRMLCKPFIDLARLVRAQVVQNDMKVLVLGDLFSTDFMKPRNSWDLHDCPIFPITRPLSTSKAANRQAVPLRL